nr:immunoglobulin light chain junction region [Macaca mulatta]MOX08173.1 immunoglobulin light chain junction region [Macaca mulatta]MOX08678.1 immunoglobulin light chain junction region [Macaca mulatta]MOX09134.1 immunoglobulin light chain junction region [Macaca mulatta]MOX10225.1 immunoglobulin light chain junction region [Macaca mulatta]
CQQSSNPPLTF